MRVDEQVRGMRPDRSVLLSASAGSGKTHVLVGRMIHLLAAGIAPEGLAAITFTEKAAAGMKEKLFGMLAGAAWDGMDAAGLLGLEPADMPYPLTRTPEEIFSELTARPDSLKVSTIHAFCLGLLRQFPLEAGLPAGFRVMDEAEMLIRRDAAADACILEAVTDLPVEFRTLIDSGYDIKKLSGLIVSALDKRGLISMLETDMGGIEGVIRHLEGGLERADKERAVNEIVAGGSIAGVAGGLAALLRESGINGEDYISALDALAGMKGPGGFPDAFERIAGYFYTKDFSYRKRSPVSGKVLKDRAGRHDEMYSSLREAVKTLAGLYDDVRATAALTAFLRIYKKADEIYTAANLRDGLVDYDDLESRAYRLFTGPDAVNALYRIESRALHYLIDEFQDTGLLQWGVLSRLNSEAFSGKGAEGLSAPTLFAVGDRKQSIYRFRKADYRLMDSLKSRMDTGMERARVDFPELDMNFRSAPEVLEVVDDVFGVIFKDGYKKSRAVRTDAKGSVKLRVVDKGGEADALAMEVAAACGLPVWDATAGSFRPAGYGDMAVLLRSRAGLRSYEEALRGHGIPFKVVGGVGFFYQEEVSALMGILGYLDNPADLMSLASALKSPLFRLSDGELEPMYTAKDQMEALRAISPEAHGLVSKWRDMAGLVPLGRLVECIIKESAALFAFGVAGGPAAALNIEKLAGIARDFDRRGGVGLSEFTDWVRSYREKADIGTADVELPGYERFVSVMTVHAAKGLEFPVVFLPGLARGTRKTSARLLLETSGRGEVRMAVRTDALLGENPQYAGLLDMEGRERRLEAARLLYVAMTRAGDHLVMLASGRPASETWLGLLSEARPASLFGKTGGPGPDEAPAVYMHPMVAPKSIAVPDAPSASMPGAALFKAPPQDRLKPLPGEPGITFNTASALAGALPGENKTGTPYPPRLRGVLVHAALEDYVRRGGYDIGAVAGRTNGFASLDKNTGNALLRDVERTLEGFLSDEKVRELLSTGTERHTELPLLVRDGSEVTSGTADLVIINGDRATVIDYKTGLTEIPIESIKAAYAPQLNAYREAVKGAFRLKAADACLLLVDRRKIIAYS